MRGVASEIADDLLGPAEGGLGVNHPILTKQSSQESGNAFRLDQVLNRSGTSKQVLSKSPPESCYKLSPKDFAENLDRQEERVLRVNPPCPVGRDSAARNDAVKVRMKEQVLTPTVKDAEETDLGAEMLGVARHLAKCFGHRVEQKVIERGLILQDERVKFVRQGKYDVEVTGLKQFLLPGVDPPATRLRRTLVAMTIATAVV